jgi:hypothetical protein
MRTTEDKCRRAIVTCLGCGEIAVRSVETRFPGRSGQRLPVRRVRIGCLFGLMVEVAADRVEPIDDVLIDDVRRNAASHLRQVFELLSGSHHQIP